MTHAGHRVDTVRFYVGVLRLPLLLSVMATVAIYCVARQMSVTRDTTFLGLLSQFDGTATTVFLALGTIGPSARSAGLGTETRARRRGVQIRFAAAFALVSFAFATAGAHYHALGAWALALNVTTIAAILWGLAGTGVET